MMHVLNMSKKDFASVPYINLYSDWNKLASNGHLEFKSFVIIPVKNKDKSIAIHESGFGCMEFCLIDKNDAPIGKIGGGCDVINLDGVGGYGADWVGRGCGIPHLIPVHGWSIDLLPCGYLNVWTRRKLFLRDNFVGSVLKVFSEDECPSNTQETIDDNRKVNIKEPCCLICAQQSCKNWRSILQPQECRSYMRLTLK
jgi:hypothetical protein